MRAFLWENVDNVTDNYHSEGSVLVIASSLQAARKLSNLGDALKETPTASWELAGDPDPWCFIFPNAGCC